MTNSAISNISTKGKPWRTYKLNYGCHLLPKWRESVRYERTNLSSWLFSIRMKSTLGLFHQLIQSSGVDLMEVIDDPRGSIHQRRAEQVGWKKNILSICYFSTDPANFTNLHRHTSHLVVACLKFASFTIIVFVRPAEVHWLKKLKKDLKKHFSSRSVVSTQPTGDLWRKIALCSIASFALPRRTSLHTMGLAFSPHRKILQIS